MRREAGADRVWVDADGVHCDVAGARLDSAWGCGLAEFVARVGLRAHRARVHRAGVLAGGVGERRDGGGEGVGI